MVYVIYNICIIVHISPGTGYLHICSILSRNTLHVSITYFFTITSIWVTISTVIGRIVK